MEMDAENTPLAAILSGDEQNALLSTFISLARAWVEAPSQANRDFEYHEDVEVYLDGTGGNGLSLAPLGFVPLIDISGIEIDGASVVEGTDYTCNSRGVLRSIAVSSSTPQFTRGTQNIVATISWGYTEYPEAIKQAQAMKVVADLMGFIERSDSESGQMPGGVNTIRFGSDLTIQMGSEGRYGRSRKELEKQAREICLGYRVTTAIGTYSY
jgi:hypothetical protein